MDVLLFTVLTASIVIIYYFFGPSNLKFPPGPKAIPLLGNILQMRTSGHKKLSEWATQFGSYYTINILGRHALVVNDLQTMQKVFGTMESTGKMKYDVFGVVFNHDYGIVNVIGADSMEQRKFFYKAVKDTGALLGSSSNEENIITEVDNICENTRKKLTEDKDASFRLKEQFNTAMFNTLWNTIGGKVLPTHGSEVHSSLLTVFRNINLASKWGLAALPILKYATKIIPSFRSLADASATLRESIKQSFEAIKRSPEQNIFNAYRKKVESCDDPVSSFYGKTGWENSYSTILALFVASADSTSTMMTWVVHYLTAHLEVQNKLHEEIEKVIGTDKPTFAHRSRMVYLQAVILESLRKASPGPFGLFHELIANINFEGFNLPKGLLLIANIYHANNDKNIWGDPENFRPERFIQETDGGDGIVLNNELKQYVVTFQVGRRQCPGESMAKDILFMITARLVQNFILEPVEGSSKDDYIEPVEGYLLKPRCDLGVKLIPRN